MRTKNLSESELAKGLELFTPIEILVQANQGNPILDAETQLVKELQENGLNDGVINVLFFFILRKDQGLNHDLVWLIANDWINRGISTASEAYFMIKKITPFNDHLRH